MRILINILHDVEGGTDSSLMLTIHVLLDLLVATIMNINQQYTVVTIVRSRQGDGDLTQLVVFGLLPNLKMIAVS